jgi:hypothetical protein
MQRVKLVHGMHINHAIDISISAELCSVVVLMVPQDRPMPYEGKGLPSKETLWENIL